MTGLSAYMQGSGLMARIVRSTSWTIVGFGTQQVLRLVSNLILVRLLFPEAFGLMALVTVVTIGLSLFSDIGLSPAIAQSKRGDDPDFLDTAWTLQILRGILLFALTFALAGPVAAFYDEPLLELYLPIAGLSLLIAGFNPTRIETARRHLLLGRMTAIDVIGQVFSIFAMVGVALLTQSAVALVIGTVVGAVVHLVLTTLTLPGHRNRPRWDWSAVTELVGFGKWIFLSTAFFFLSSQGDKAILGKFLSLEALGIYNIGYFLAAFPMALGLTVTHRVLIPVYRDRPPAQSAENAAKVSRLRHAISGFVMGMTVLMALGGPAIVDLLYDDRYTLAGGILVLVSLVQMIPLVGLTYDQVALAAGNSRDFFVYTAARSALQVSLLLVGVSQFGLLGAMAGWAMANLLAYPILIRLARRHGAWDGRHDALWIAVAALIATLALWLNWIDVAALIGFGVE